MASVHEMLYESEEFSQISFREYVEKISRELIHSYYLKTDISLDLQIEDIYLGIDSAVPCGLILNELMTNSLKHAFPGRKKGRIKISMRSLKDQSYEFIFKDDGVGIPDSFNVKESKTLGLNLIEILTEQIQGNVIRTSKNGTIFKIVFPGVK